MAFSSYRIRLKAKLTVNLPIPVPPFFNNDVPVQLELEAGMFGSDWELNAIPTCRLSVPLGRLMDDEEAVAGIALMHWVTNYLELLAPLEVYASVEPLDASDGDFDKWPEGFFKVFEGFATTTGYRKNFGQVEFTIGGIHWLSHLDFSSPFSEVSHPFNPTQYTFKASAPILGITNPHNTGAMSRDSLAKAFFSVKTIREDFWASGYKVELAFGDVNEKDGLKHWFEAIGRERRFNWQQIQALFPEFVPQDGTNVNILSALSKFEPFNGKYTYGLPLKMDMDDATANLAASAIKRHIGRTTVESFTGVTIWDKLVGQFGPEYMFSIIPMVDRALVVPTNPFYRLPWKKIASKDYNYIEYGTPLPRPLRAVGILTGTNSLTGSDGSMERSTKFSGVTGFYQGRRDGMTIITNGPQWMMGYTATDWVEDSVKVGGTMANAFAPNAAGPRGDDTRAGRFITASRDLATRYAKFLYLQQVMQGRQAMVSGKLRFDISPGSIVEVEGSAEKWVNSLIGELNTTEQKIYGQVLRTSILIDRQAQRAGTAFHIGFIRNGRDNEDDSLSAPRHPLWNRPFPGAPLVSEETFGTPGGNTVINDDNPNFFGFSTIPQEFLSAEDPDDTDNIFVQQIA